MTRSSKVYHTANFLEDVHQWQTDIVPVAGVIVPSSHPLVKPHIVPPGTLQWKKRWCQLHVPFAVDYVSSGCSRDFFDWDLQGWSWQCLTLSFCSFTSLIPGAGMWVCWNSGRWCCAARLCKAHTSVNNIEPWHSLTARLQSRLWPALTTYRPEAAFVLWPDSVACFLFIVCIWKVGICNITYFLCYVPPLLHNKTMQHI